MIEEYKKFLQSKDKKKPNSSGISCFILNNILYFISNKKVLDKIKGVTTSGEFFLKELHNAYGKFETFNFIKGNFLQVINFQKNQPLPRLRLK